MSDLPLKQLDIKGKRSYEKPLPGQIMRKKFYIWDETSMPCSNCQI